MMSEVNNYIRDIETIYWRQTNQDKIYAADCSGDGFFPFFCLLVS